MNEERNTVALFNESGAHVGYLHLPTGQITTTSGRWSDPSVNMRTGRPTKAHQARIDAAARAKKVGA